MELRHLRYFVAVAEALSFTKAAENLHLAQPSLTRQIKDLEAEIGVRLFDRSGKRISLTQEGESFLQDARRLLAEMRAKRASGTAVEPRRSRPTQHQLGRQRLPRPATRDTGGIPQSLSPDRAEPVRHDASRAIPRPRRAQIPAH
jgi:DNA-binding transcriptional LysR family regulator